MNGNQLVTATSIWTAGYVVGQLPCQYILTFVSPRWVIPSLELGWGILTLATYCVNDYRVLYALRFLIGLAESAFYPSIHYLLGSWVRGLGRCCFVLERWGCRIPPKEALSPSTLADSLPFVAQSTVHAQGARQTYLALLRRRQRWIDVLRCVQSTSPLPDFANPDPPPLLPLFPAARYLASGRLPQPRRRPRSCWLAVDVSSPFGYASLLTTRAHPTRPQPPPSPPPPTPNTPRSSRRHLLNLLFLILRSRLLRLTLNLRAGSSSTPSSRSPSPSSASSSCPVYPGTRRPTSGSRKRTLISLRLE